MVPTIDRVNQILVSKPNKIRARIEAKIFPILIFLIEIVGTRLAINIATIAT